MLSCRKLSLDLPPSHRECMGMLLWNRTHTGDVLGDVEVVWLVGTDPVSADPLVLYVFRVEAALPP